MEYLTENKNFCFSQIFAYQKF